MVGMSEPLEVRIGVRPIPGLKVEIVLYDPQRRKESKIGMEAGPGQDDIDRKVIAVKGQLERAGNRVNVVNLDRRF